MIKSESFIEKDIEAAIEWSKDNLTLKDLSEKFGKMQAPSLYIALARHLKEGVKRGMVKFNSKKK